VTAGWLLASTLSPPVARLQSLPQRQPKPSAAEPEVGFTEQLKFRLQRVPDPPKPRRNPFSFGERPRPVVAQTSAQPAGGEAAVTLPPPLVAGPAFSLSGIGVTGDTRTAILSDGQAVYVVKIGERVGQYEIVDITDGSVTLGEASGLRYVLRLR
jgi:hypothetical protein